MGFGSRVVVKGRSRRFEITKMFLPHPLVKLGIVGSLRDREVACSASDLQVRILCLEGSVISLMSPSSGGSHGPI